MGEHGGDVWTNRKKKREKPTEKDSKADWTLCPWWGGERRDSIGPLTSQSAVYQWGALTQSISSDSTWAEETQPSFSAHTPTTKALTETPPPTHYILIFSLRTATVTKEAEVAHQDNKKEADDVSEKMLMLIDTRQREDVEKQERKEERRRGEGG